MLPDTSLCAESRLAWMQEVIVSAAVLGAGAGAAVGGFVSDRLGRKTALLAGDVMFAFGAILMAAAGSPDVLIVGQPLRSKMTMVL